MREIIPAVLRVKDAAAYIGVDRTTIWQFRKQYLLPYVQITPHKVGFLRADLDQFLKDRRVAGSADAIKLNDRRRLA